MCMCAASKLQADRYGDMGRMPCDGRVMARVLHQAPASHERICVDATTLLMQQVFCIKLPLVNWHDSVVMVGSMLTG